ncbi:hypothetical protein [Nostoc sp.]|uniref:hypothetical protein n=1 Tax=Nostoc sp. TaxID=1180 RepID=UPI002FFB86D8
MSTNPEKKDVQLDHRTTQLETKTQPLSLSERVEKIEVTLLLIADVYRFQQLNELLTAGS